MDDAGIDTAVLSMTTPGLQNLPAAEAVALQQPPTTPSRPPWDATPGASPPSRRSPLPPPRPPPPNCAGRRQPRLRRCHGQRPLRRTGRRRRRVLGHLRGGRRAARPPLPPPPRPAARRRAGLLRGVRRTRGQPAGDRRGGLALRRRTDAPADDRLRTLRPVPRPPGHPRALGRGRPVLPRPHRRSRTGRPPPAAGRRVLPHQRLHHARRHLQPPLPALEPGDGGRRTDHVRHRLPLQPGA